MVSGWMASHSRAMRSATLRVSATLYPSFLRMMLAFSLNTCTEITGLAASSESAMFLRSRLDDLRHQFID
jgi:hypothetical protein